MGAAARLSLLNFWDSAWIPNSPLVKLPSKTLLSYYAIAAACTKTWDMTTNRL